MKSILPTIPVNKEPSSSDFAFQMTSGEVPYSPNKICDVFVTELTPEICKASVLKALKFFCKSSESVTANRFSRSKPISLF